jgi:putative DNA primase/helicase
MIQHAWDVSKLRSLKPLTTNRINEILAALRRKNYIPLSKFYEAKYYINAKNGLISLETWELEPHRPEVYFLTQLDAEYDPNVYAEEWDDFLKKVTDTESILVLQEFIGYCLLPDCRFEKALALVGPGGSGKSTFLEVVRAVLGDDNTTGFSIQQLESERFARSELIGKLVNIYNDLPYTALEKSDIFKQLVSGDPIQVERKYKQPFLARLYAKLIFSANQLPPTRDYTNAFFRR